MNVRRREFVLALGASAALPLRAQGRIPRVVFPFAMSERGKERVRRLLAENGWHEGRNVTLQVVPVADATEGQGDASRPDHVERLAREVVMSRPDVIAMPAFNEVSLFQRLTRDIPIVFYHYGSDPVQAGWVASLRRPGGNITGTTLRRVEAIPKYWSLLKELRPGARRGGTLTTNEYRAEGAHWELVKEQHAVVEAVLGIRMVDVTFPKDASFQEVKAAIASAGVDLLSVVLHPPWRHMAALIAHLRDARIAAIYVSGTQAVRMGGLIAHTPDFALSERIALEMVARILRGEDPGSIPVYEVHRYHVAMNRRTARAMDLVVPPSLALQVDEWFE